MKNLILLISPNIFKRQSLTLFNMYAPWDGTPWPCPAAASNTIHGSLSLSPKYLRRWFVNYWFFIDFQLNLDWIVVAWITIKINSIMYSINNQSIINEKSNKIVTQYYFTWTLLLVIESSGWKWSTTTWITSHLFATVSNYIQPKILTMRV